MIQKTTKTSYMLAITLGAVAAGAILASAATVQDILQHPIHGVPNWISWGQAAAFLCGIGPFVLAAGDRFQIAAKSR